MILKCVPSSVDHVAPGVLHSKFAGYNAYEHSHLSHYDVFIH